MFMVSSLVSELGKSLFHAVLFVAVRFNTTIMLNPQTNLDGMNLTVAMA